MSQCQVWLDRFCASGLEQQTPPRKMASGWDDLVVAGGDECRQPMGSNGGAMASDPAFMPRQALATYLKVSVLT